MRPPLNQAQAVRYLSGICPEMEAAVIAGHLLAQRRELNWVLCANPRSAEATVTGLRRFLDWSEARHPPPVVHYPAAPSGDIDVHRLNDLLGERLATLAHLAGESGGPLVIVSTPDALLGPCPRRATLDENRIELKPGQHFAFSVLAEDLAARLDYDAEAVCEHPGQFAVRGGLIDVYPFDADRPFRIDFFGDEIESIRTFDPASQRSLEAVNAVTLHAAIRNGREPGHIVEYLPPEPLEWILSDPTALSREHPDFFERAPARKGPPRTFDELNHSRDGRDWLTGISYLDTEPARFREAPRTSFESEPIDNYRNHPDAAQVGLDRFESEQGARHAFERHLLEWAKAGVAITFTVAGQAERQRIEELLAENPLTRKLKPRFLTGTLPAGFVSVWNDGERPPLPLPVARGQTGLALVTDNEYFGRRQRRLVGTRERMRPNLSQVDHLLDFSELADGDPLVHLQHGICLFRGLTRIAIADGNKEVISLEFANGMALHVPLHESHLLTRYVGLGKAAPKLGKIGGSAWQKTRAAAEQATLDFAAELLSLHARREQAGGYAFAPDHPWQKAFEDAFPYNETRDQLTAIESTKDDMEQSAPMDRLICGDVGFGKTEVALRAAFKAVMSGRQVAVLVPTTVLCQQHFNTFRERMAEYPLIIEMVSRFRSAKQNKEILSNLAAGQIDILIGTHRILSNDVVFNNLGLLVVDEEQRFGVKQKEQIKRLRANVDILTLSATPIPRTLYMALSGARAMSVIETPPVDRLPIQTIVKPYDKSLIRSAIQSEIDRGGQVFYLHNRVDSIERVAAELNDMLPSIKVAVGHGQMSEQQLERIMTRFVAGDYDVLVCTTIIESGLDIPNCNTLIIEGADRFGLAQLYQIRGRVGRFKRQAYAYLLLHRHGHIVEQAHKRLSALRHHNQLGAGFRIAMRDLELRGAGNLLGAQQSGHIAGVGFDLYCQLLQQSVARLKGEPGADRIRAEVQLDFITTGEGVSARQSTSGSDGFAALKEAEYHGKFAKLANASLPPDYIDEARLRIDCYRRLAMCEQIEAIESIHEELNDRFGKPPNEVLALLAITRIRVQAERAGVNRVGTEGDRLMCRRAHPGSNGEYLKSGTRFPRLRSRQSLKRLAEIERFLRTSA